ncbi:hypothetical protein [Streptomyces amritsarensis]|uniref:hypothetical protein n=1 Tax=Streptomyces amritsarensis TaxID=681158 RepID=UPI0036A26F31
MAAGVLAATLLIRCAPGPTSTVHLALMAVFLLQAAAVALSPETGRPHTGAWRSLRPRVAVSSPARRAFLISGPGVVAVWALGGFYSSLGPAFVRPVAPGAPQAAGGMVFSTLSLSAAVTVCALVALLGMAALPALPTARAAAGPHTGRGGQRVGARQAVAGPAPCGDTLDPWHRAMSGPQATRATHTAQATQATRAPRARA